MRFVFVFLFFLVIRLVAFSQLSISNGVGLPSSDTIRALIIFAEVDFNNGPCRSNIKEGFTGSWGEDENGNAVIPAFAGDYLDVDLKNGELPKGVITTQFHEASFGQYVLLGDYLPEIVTVACKDIRPRQNGLTQILKILDGWNKSDSTLYSNSGLPLSEFDLWTGGKRGEPKLKEPDGRIDLLYIMWRNNVMLTGYPTMSTAGYGVSKSQGKAFKNMKGTNNVASFNAADGVGAGKFITIAEHLHGIYGGNNWHSSAGAGTHTFLCRPKNYGLTGQSGSTSQMVSGWDRWIQRWKPSEKKFVISAFDTNGVEVNTELVNISDHEKGLRVVLRDFMTTGDAIRIKLPYVSDDTLVKNQYLWLENRQFKMSTDEYLQYPCSNNLSGKYPKGTPGVYAYIQVGKDERDGTNSIYSNRHKEPNGLASPFFPLSAEGNFDLGYRFDLVDKATAINLGCNWNNASIPLDRQLSNPNAFTGHSDLYCMYDTDGDGKLHSGGDRVQMGFSELQNDSVIFTYFANGDWMDAFAKATGNTKMAIYTNPAPVPVYTLASNYQYKKFGFKDGVFGEFENRTIWLNGLSVSMTELGEGNIRIDITWDEFEVKENVRWCGNIRLSPNHINSKLPSLIISDKKKILLDRGESATVNAAFYTNDKGEKVFTEGTELVLDSASVMELKYKSMIILKADSKLTIKKGAKLIMGKCAKIILAPHAELIIENGSEIIKHPRAQIRKR